MAFAPSRPKLLLSKEMTWSTELFRRAREATAKTSKFTNKKKLPQNRTCECMNPVTGNTPCHFGQRPFSDLASYCIKPLKGDATLKDKVVALKRGLLQICQTVWDVSRHFNGVFAQIFSGSPLFANVFYRGLFFSAQPGRCSTLTIVMIMIMIMIIIIIVVIIIIIPSITQSHHDHHHIKICYRLRIICWLG